MGRLNSCELFNKEGDEMKIQPWMLGPAFCEPKYEYNQQTIGWDRVQAGLTKLEWMAGMIVSATDVDKVTNESYEDIGWHAKELAIAVLAACHEAEAEKEN